MNEQLASLLRNTVGFEVVESKVDDKYVMLLGRLKQDAAALNLMAGYIYANAAKAAWNADIVKALVHKPTEENPFHNVAAWRIALYGAEVPVMLSVLESAARAVPAKPKVEVVEVPLPAPPDRNAPNAKGKGAGPSGTMFTGKMALMRYGGG